MLMVVVLPAPLGPSRARISPAPHGEIQPGQDRLLPEGLAQVADFDGRAREFRCARWRPSGRGSGAERRVGFAVMGASGGVADLWTRSSTVYGIHCI